MTADAGEPGLPKPGQEIDGFRIVEKLGEGSFGTVYRVEKEGLPFALKLAHGRAELPAARRSGPDRSLRELECLLALRHPNIARVWSHGRWPHPKQGLLPLRGVEWQGKPIDAPPQAPVEQGPPAPVEQGPPAPVEQGPPALVEQGPPRLARQKWWKGKYPLAAAGGLLTLVLGLSLGWLARPHEPQPIAAVEGSSPTPQPAPPVQAVNPPPAPPALSGAPPVPRAVQQPSPSKRGSTVKRAEEVEQSAPSVCTRKEPPPADRPALLRQLCRCAGIALAFASACTGAQLRPSSGERCPDEALEAMDKLELPQSFHIYIDEAQPYSATARYGVFKEGPITSLFYKDVGKVPKGSRIFGEMIGPFPHRADGSLTWKILYTRLQPPGEKAVPVCAVLGPDDGVLSWFDGSRPGAVLGNKREFVNTVTRWPQWP